MDSPSAPFDASGFEKREASSFIYEPVLGRDGRPEDFRIVHASDAFARSWDKAHRGDPCRGALLRKGAYLDERSLRMLERFCSQPPEPFSAYLPSPGRHLLFEPIRGLQPPYAGFYLTDVSSHVLQDTKAHFLHSIRQMGGNAALFQRHEDGRIEALYASEDFAEMMECTVPEAMELVSGMGFYKSTNPEDRPLVRSMLRRRVAYDGTSSLTIQKITAKRNRVWCSTHYAFIDDFGESYLYCTYTDMTALKQHEERMRSIYSSLGDSYYQATDKTLCTFRVNLTRDSFEEVKGKDLYDTDSPVYSYTEGMRGRAAHYPIESERQQFLRLFDREAMLSRYATGKTSASQVLYSIRKDGRACFAEVSASITRHPLTGDAIAFITERECNGKKVADTLTGKILVQQFDMVAYLVNGRYGVTIGDAARIKQGSIFPTTNAGDYRAYLENQVEPALAGTVAEKRAALEALSLEAVEEHLRVEEPYVVDIRLELGGETYYKRFDFYTVDPESRFYILLKSDTTAVQEEQMAMNERLREALRAAEQANVAKTSFLSSMSHEIRTPMNAIIGLDAIALKDPGLSRQTRDHLEKIGSSAQHLLGLINDVLDMSRIESGRMTLKNEEFSFSNMLDQVNTMVSSQCQDRGLNYECRVLGAVDDYYIGDDMKLKQVIINILGNAVKFTPQGGLVTFTVERIATFDDQSTLRLRMEDTGIGMDEDYLPKIFDAFSQENEGKANKYGSTGLGMAITKNIVEMMNGNISVESEKGAGTTFTVVVTLRNSSRTDRADDVRPEDLHVLVIDDSPVDCEHARIVLEEVGVQADICMSGREAVEAIKLKAARREAYNMILVDWKMPGQNGIEVTREIRTIIDASSAVVVLTAYNWDDIADEAIGAGVDSFIRKPLFASNVMSVFGQVIQNKREADAREDAPLADLAGRTVLLAEDVEINAEIMMELLGMMEIGSVHAENGQEAIDKFAQSEPGTFDAILMDIRMPVLDGLEAAKGIRALDRPDARRVPIIAMTANAFDEDVQRSLQAGMNAHLSKPVEPELLFQTLGELIED